MVVIISSQLTEQRYRKWTIAKYILGCAIFITLCAILVMQHNQLDILAALDCLLRSVKEVEKLESTQAHTCSHGQKCSKEGDSTIKKAQQLKDFDTVQTHFESHHEKYCTLINKSRLAWSNL